MLKAGCLQPSGVTAAAWARDGAHQMAPQPPRTRLHQTRVRPRWRQAAEETPREVAAPKHAAPAPSSAAVAWVEQLQTTAAACLPASRPDAGATEVDVAGAAVHMGLEMEWTLAFDRHGSFLEKLSSPQICCSWGYAAAADNSVGSPSPSSTNGSPSTSSPASSSINGSGYFGTNGVCWASDDARCPRQMQLDDEEALLLSTWVRTGVWILPRIAAQLEISAAPHPAHVGASKAAKGSSGRSNMAWVQLRLRDGGRVTALLELCPSTWRPRSMLVQLVGDEELWQLTDWHEWQPGLWLAGTMVQNSGGEGGVVNTYAASSVQVHSPPSQRSGMDGSVSGSSVSSSTSRFLPPPTPLLPADSAFLAGVSEEVPGWHTSSGHSLVRPLINGQDVGYFIFDTGSSVIVLDPAVADALGLESFGELQVTATAGKVPAQFRRAASFQLGPLLIKRPLLVEMSCAGVVMGLAEGERIAGIVGHDVLRRAVVHMPPHPRRPDPAAEADVDSPSAAVAAMLSSSKVLMKPLQFNLRLQHPAAADDANAAMQDATSASSGSLLASAATAAAMGSRADTEPDRRSAQLGSTCCVVDVSSSSSGTTSSTSSRMRSQHPVQHRQPLWLPLVMVAGLPHVEVELVATDGRRHSGLFMIDSGAGGFDVIVYPNAAKDLGLGRGGIGADSRPTRIKGIGFGDTHSLPAQRCELAEARLGPATFTPMSAIYRPPDGPGLVLSQHTSGIVCAGVLDRCTLLFDYPRLRMAVLEPDTSAQRMRNTFDH